MGKNKCSARDYEVELKELIRARTGKDWEPWLLPQIRSTAKNEALMDKIEEELLNNSLTSLVTGSTGQVKTEVNPLLPYFDRLNRTLMLQFEALGLNFNTTPAKVSESAKPAGEADDVLAMTLLGGNEDKQ